jgi:hypothetical protein
MRRKRTAAVLAAAMSVVVTSCGGSHESDDLQLAADESRLPHGFHLPRGVTAIGPVWTLAPGTKDARQSLFVEVAGDMDQVAERLALEGQRIVDAPKQWAAAPLPGASCYNEGPGERYCGFGDSGLRFKKWWPVEFALVDDARDTLPPSGWIWFGGDPTELVVPPPGEPVGPSTVAADIDGEAPLQIVDGSFVAAQPPAGSVTGGYSLVIAVTGDPDDVFDAYVDQDPLESTEEDTDEQHGDLHYRRYRSSGAGAGGFDLVLNEAGGNAWLLIKRWND